MTTILAGAPVLYFVTLDCRQRQPLLATPEMKSLALEALLHTQARLGIHVAAYAILDNHLHGLFDPAPASCEHVLNHFRAVTRRLCRSHHPYSWRDTLWNGDYRSSVVTSEADLRAHLDWIHYDPVHHGYVDRPAAYPWSSLAARIRQGHYPEDWASLGPPASISGLTRHYAGNAAALPIRSNGCA